MTVTVDIELAKRYKKTNDEYEKYRRTELKLISLFDEI